MVMDRISALMDGELDDREAQSIIVRLKDDSELRIRWDDFHLVRDALRGEPLLSSTFNEKLSQQLAAEPTVLAPRRLLPRTRRVVTYAMSAAASVAAAGLVLNVAMSPDGQLAPGPVAKQDEAVQSASVAPQPQQPQVVPYDGRWNTYLLAHEAVVPGANLPRVTPLMRTVAPGSAERR
jgi:sigma-E factor negative regulatory protein RseA